MRKNILENKVEAVLKKIRPFIQMHGGDVRLVEIKGSIVTLKIFGTCVDCPLANLTYNKMVGALIKEKMPKIKKVVII
jgi:Fe-S cluster biogenesis protein NfuA